ncbi:uncharacterized protein LOC142323473 isoform X2 [Lycorma delicatula]|uniref:uncharacterized protein LOC142323473 isoform X2 n=1 Tax=Lycorma delicatula TaxID=130591 RepID=UPI003F516180
MDKSVTTTTSTPLPKKSYDAENLNESLKVIQLLEQLRLLSIRGNLEGVKSAIEQGISVNQTLKGGWSPLLFACSMGHPDVVEYLLKVGADPDFHKERFTALMAACASTRENEDKLVKCVDLLVKYNADVNATERHHISALMFAAKEGHAKIVSKLVNCNCTLNLQDGQGWTALFWAVNQGKAKVVEILIRAGASADIKDRRSQTAVDLAHSKGLDEILNIFNNPDKLSMAVCEEDQNSLNLNKKFNDMYEDLTLESEHNIVDNSLGDAVLLMKTTMKHLGVLYAGTSYVRLRLQGRPVDLPVERKCTDAAGLVSITEKALHQTYILQEELKFLHQHVKKLEECDKIVPADVVVQRRDKSYKKLTSFILISALAVLIYNNRANLPKILTF